MTRLAPIETCKSGIEFLFCRSYVLELPNRQRWAVEIKRGLATMDRALRVAFDDLQPDRAIVVHGRAGRFPKGGGVEAMDLSALIDDLRALA